MLPAFCPRCGHAIPPPPAETWEVRCDACGVTHYENAKPAVGVLLTNDRGEVLLARRAIPPYQGDWDIVGGFLLPYETPQVGAHREVLEETGLEIELGQLLGIWIDRYGEGGDYTFNTFYIGRVIAGTMQPQDDVAELRWFGPDALPDNIAFNGRAVIHAWREATAGGQHDTQEASRR